MIFIKLLGILDILVGILFWLFGIFGIIPNSWILFSGLFLLLKGIVFITGLSIVSFLDIISSGIIILSVYTALPNVIVIIVSLFLIQKGIFSILG